MSERISISAMPANDVTYWRPVDNSQNIVVMLSRWDATDPEANVPSCNQMVRGFTNSKFGTSYPINFSYPYLGKNKNDPKDILMPELKFSFLSIVYVGVKYSDGNWKTAMWQITSMGMHRQLIMLADSNDITGKAIGVQKSGTAWSPYTASKVKVSDEIVSQLMESVPSLPEIIKSMNFFETSEEIWNYLINCSKGAAKTKEELMTLFGVGSNSELL